MSSDKINLEEILKKELIPTVFDGSSELTFNATINAMKEACRQTLELAAENAKVESKNYFEASKEELINGIDVYFNEIDDRPTNIHIVDKQSILDTIKQVE